MRLHYFICCSEQQKVAKNENFLIENYASQLKKILGLEEFQQNKTNKKIQIR